MAGLETAPPWADFTRAAADRVIRKPRNVVLFPAVLFHG
jgi:hypothetical protein